MQFTLSHFPFKYKRVRAYAVCVLAFECMSVCVCVYMCLFMSVCLTSVSVLVSVCGSIYLFYTYTL